MIKKNRNFPKVKKNVGSSLVDASITTLEWLDKIELEIKQKIPTIRYKYSKYWVTLKSFEKNRNIAALHLQKTQIRLFTKLPPFYDHDLDLSPSSGAWAEYFPSIFTIRSEESIEKGIDLILKAYNYDLIS